METTLGALRGAHTQTRTAVSWFPARSRVLRGPESTVPGLAKFDFGPLKAGGAAGRRRHPSNREIEPVKGQDVCSRAGSRGK